MKKLRLVILSLSIFSVFTSAFFNLAYIVIDNTYNMNNELINAIRIPFASNFFTFLVMMLITLAWYLFHIKDRNESITSGLVLLMYLVYLVFFILACVKLYEIYQDISTYNENYHFEKYLDSPNIWYSLSLIILVTPGMWNLISLIPLLLHFIASVATNGYDNVPEPDNIYGFMFTTIGLCYIGAMVVTGFACKDSITAAMFAFKENGLIMTIITLTFILCAGLRFNSVILDVFNIVMNFIFIITWIVILSINKTYTAIHIYYGMYHLIFIIPMFILSFFILKHYVLVDRFYKGITKNFINE